MANVLGASSPKTTCKNEAMNRATAIAMGWSSEAGRPKRLQQRLDQVRDGRLGQGADAERADRDAELADGEVLVELLLGDLDHAGRWLALLHEPVHLRRPILTKANSAATNRPFKATSKSAARILRIGRPADATTSRMTPRKIGSASRAETRGYSICR
jgi:hypothetical protein